MVEVLTAGEAPLSRWRRIITVGGLFSDGALIYGLKFGLAGMLAIFIALVIRANNPTWALFTVFVLMIAQYVGAIGEKSVFRMIGTVVGGLIGYLLTATLEQNPIIFLTLVGLVVAFCTAMFGQSRYPYAFLLCGLTTVVVVSNGLTDPDNCWTFMLWRDEEVGIGIIAVLLIQSLFWPRYARVEFSANVRSACADLRACFSASARIFLEGGGAEDTIRAETFPARISGLRGLLDFGSRESLYFRTRLPTYFEITNCLSRIASATVTLGDTLPTESRYRGPVTDSIREVHDTLAMALDDLSQESSSEESRREHRSKIAATFKTFDDGFEALRNQPGIFDIPTEEVMLLGLHCLALENIRDQIKLLHQLQDSLPENPRQYSRQPEAFAAPIPPQFWIRSGLKSGIAIVAALILDNWLQPPGGTTFMLGTWVFTATNSSSPGGQGDRRAFEYTIYSVFSMLLLCIGLIAFTPLMSSYAVMNVVIFTWLFVWGYLSYTTKGLTIPMQVAMLAVVGILGLNAQEPVTFQAILGVFYGISFAAVLAAVIQRLLWPSLPQRELQKRYVEYLNLCRRAIDEGPSHLPLWQRARLALIPGEAMQRIQVLHPPICPVGEPQLLTGYLHTLQRVGGHLFATVGRLGPLLPDPHAERGRELIAQLERVLKVHLEAHARDIKAALPVAVDNTPLKETLEAWRVWTAEMRAWMVSQKYPIPDSLRILGLTGRYRQTGYDFLKADEQAARLRLALYMGDYVL